MYAVNQCSDPRDFVSPRYQTFKVSVLSSDSISSIDAKTITSNVDVQKVRTVIFEEVKGKADISIKLVRVFQNNNNNNNNKTYIAPISIFLFSSALKT